MKLLAPLVLALVLLAPALARADVPTEADLVACIGGKKSPWTPTVAAKLKDKMTPEEAGKVFPGAEKVSKFGFVTVKLEGCVGATELELYFAKDKVTKVPTELQSVRIQFDGALTANAEFYSLLVKVLEAKYGKVKKPESIEKKLITWVNPKFRTAQLTVKPVRGGGQFQLSTGL
jgi:hypothetical protein